MSAFREYVRRTAFNICLGNDQITALSIVYRTVRKEQVPFVAIDMMTVRSDSMWSLARKGLIVKGIDSRWAVTPEGKAMIPLLKYAGFVDDSLRGHEEVLTCADGDGRRRAA